jgi:hypothetical protein
MMNLKYLKMKILAIALLTITFTLITFNKAERIKTENSPKDNKLEWQQPGEFVKKKLSEMTLREKIAQMIVANAVPENYSDGSADQKKFKKLCAETKVGGFIFFKGSSSDYTRLANDLQSYSETPLLIGSDFERGTKMRVTDGALFPTNMAIGAADNKELCYKMGLEIARETRLLGIHQNYSPVCDVNNNPNNPIINVRSFGEDPQLVSNVRSDDKGLQDGKVIATETLLVTEILISIHLTVPR